MFTLQNHSHDFRVPSLEEEAYQASQAAKAVADGGEESGEEEEEDDESDEETDGSGGGGVLSERGVRLWLSADARQRWRSTMGEPSGGTQVSVEALAVAVVALCAHCSQFRPLQDPKLKKKDEREGAHSIEVGQ